VLAAPTAAANQLIDALSIDDRTALFHPSVVSAVRT
jgi:hypothetical protein